MLTTKQRLLNRRKYQRTYRQRHRLKMNHANKGWRNLNDYDKKYYELHKEEKKAKQREYYHKVAKVKKASLLLVVGKTFLSNRDIIGNAELKSRARARYGLTKAQLQKAAIQARKVVQSVTPKKPHLIRPRSHVNPPA